MIDDIDTHSVFRILQGRIRTELLEGATGWTTESLRSAYGHRYEGLGV